MSLTSPAYYYSNGVGTIMYSVNFPQDEKIERATLTAALKYGETAMALFPNAFLASSVTATAGSGAWSALMQLKAPIPPVPSVVNGQNTYTQTLIVPLSGGSPDSNLNLTYTLTTNKNIYVLRGLFTPTVSGTTVDWSKVTFAPSALPPVDNPNPTINIVTYTLATYTKSSTSTSVKFQSSVPVTMLQVSDTFGNLWDVTPKTEATVFTASFIGSQSPQNLLLVSSLGPANLPISVSPAPGPQPTPTPTPGMTFSNVTGTYTSTGGLVVNWTQTGTGTVVVTDSNGNTWVVGTNSATVTNPVPGSYTSVFINGTRYTFPTPITVPGTPPDGTVSNVTLAYNSSTNTLNASWQRTGTSTSPLAVSDPVNGNWVVAGNSASFRSPAAGTYSTVVIGGKSYPVSPVVVAAVTPEKKGFSWTSWYMILIYVVVGLLVVGLVIWLIVALTRKKPAVTTTTKKTVQTPRRGISTKSSRRFSDE